MTSWTGTLAKFRLANNAYAADRSSEEDFLATNKKRDFEFRKRKGNEDLGREDRFDF